MAEAAIQLQKRYIDQMIAHARSEAPNECCGVLAGKNSRVIKLYCTTNAEHSRTRYSVEPSELINIYGEMDKNGWELLAIYHSHPNTAAYPSEIDIKYAFSPTASYIIISLADTGQPTVRAFHIVEGKVKQDELQVIE